MTNRTIDTLSTIDRKEVQEIGKAINDKFLEANSHAERAIASYLEVGKLLFEARQFFPGDLEYGKWRAENTTLSQSWANKLLKVHATYGDKPPKELPISALAELTTLPKEKRKEMEKKAADPKQKTPSVRDIKAEKRKVGADRVAEQLAKKPKVDTKSVEDIAQLFVDMPFEKRVKYWQDGNQTVEDAYVLYGLPPYFDGAPNIDTIILLTTALWTEHKEGAINEAYAVIKETLK